MATPAKTFHFFVITYLKDGKKCTVRLRAIDLRRAKLAAKRKFGSSIKVVHGCRQKEYQSRLRSLLGRSAH